MKKRILTLLLALVLIVGTCTTALATDNSTSDNQVDVQWVYDENGQCTWEVRSGLADGVTHYFFQLRKDITVDDTIWYSFDEDWIVPVEENKNYVSVNFTRDIISSGNYYVEVYECYQVSTIDNTSWTKGDCLGTSKIATYTRPEKNLETVYGTIGKDRILRFDAVENADYYIVDICSQRGFGGKEHVFEVYPQESSTKTLEVDISQMVRSYAISDGEIWISAIIWAKSNEINDCASGYGHDPEAPYEAIFKNKHYISLTDDELKEFVQSYSMIEDYDFIINSLTTETLQKAMNKDTETNDTIKTIEEKYMEKNSITVSTKVEQDASALVDGTKISMVGTALNVEETNTNAELVIQIPKENIDVPTDYTNVVQLDISLLIGEENTTELDVPITIKMPIPKGVDTKDLVILHYHDNATTPKVITPTVNADGTITFTVSGFSTFVFCNTTTNGSANTNNTTTTIEKAPATGDTTSMYFFVLTMMLALGSIVVCMKRRTFTKTN